MQKLCTTNTMKQSSEESFGSLRAAYMLYWIVKSAKYHLIILIVRITFKKYPFIDSIYIRSAAALENDLIALIFFFCAKKSMILSQKIYFSRVKMQPKDIALPDIKQNG